MAGRGKKFKFTDEQMAEIIRLARLNCNTNTIAEAIGVSDDLLNQRPDIMAILRKNRALHRIDVREGQAEVAKSEGKSRATMLIWQGKNALGQTDRVDKTSGGEKIQASPVIINVDGRHLKELGAKPEDLIPVVD